MAADDQTWVGWAPSDAGPEVDPWAWLRQPEEPEEDVDLSGVRVTAVLVTLDAARWLPETLEGLAGLRTRPTRLIAVDVASADGTRSLLERARDQGLLDAVYSAVAGSGFGQAVAYGLEQDAAVAPLGTRAADWLWLLHDDAVPAPDALEQLLRHVTTAPEPVDLTGPKLLQPQRHPRVRRLSELGVTITGTGRRELGLEPGEIDQGQRDEPAARLGVSTCGMLLRASAWQRLGGLDPALPVFRDGVELGWRAHRAGLRVVTTPSAEFVHRQVGRAGLRPRGAAGRRPEVLDRELGLLVVAGHAPRSWLPLVWLRLLVSCLGHGIGYLLGKAPGRARDEMFALASFVAHPGRLRSFRRRHPSPWSAAGSSTVRGLRPPWWSGLRLAAEAVSGAVSSRYRSLAGDPETASLDELTGDDFAVVREEQRTNPWLSPVVITVALTVAASLVAARELLGPGHLAGPALLPAPDRLGAFWRSALDPIAGAPDHSSPPWLALMAAASTLLAGRPEWVVTVLLCAVVPLALLAVYPVLRQLVNDRRVRLWAGLSYALLPVLLGGTNQGRLTVSVAALLLPLLALAVRAIALRRPRAPEAWRGGWGAGVVLVVLVAFEPALFLLAAVFGAIGAVLLRRTPRKVGRIGVALAVPVVALAAWWPSVAAAPGRLLTGPDAALGGVGEAPPVWRLLLGQGLGPGTPPAWVSFAVFGSLWLVAGGGLLWRGQHRAVRMGWTVGLLGFTAAAAVSRLVVAVPPVGTEVRPWPGTLLLVGFVGLLLAGAVGADALPELVRRRSFSWRQPATLALAVAAGLVVLLGAGWWVWAGATGPVARTTLSGIPPYVTNVMQGETRARVLAIDLRDGTARYAVVADDQTRLGDADRGYTFGGSGAARAQVDDLVVRLVAGTADADITPELRGLGVGYLWVAGADEDAQARIDNTPGLGAASGTATAILWQLQPATSRSVVLDGDTETPVSSSPAALARGGDSRTLRLGEPVDPRWRAELDGVALTPRGEGWQQAFALPAGGGALTWRLPSPTPWLLLGQAVFLLVAGVLAAPGIRRPEVRDPTRTARRAATVGGLR
ncbi:MAG: glycosyltransferase [Actinomycetes bacterium]